MTKRYAIWNGKDTIYTPSGTSFTPDQWIERYGWMKNPNAVPVVAQGLINGAFCGELSQMKDLYEKDGADFSACETNEDILQAIEDFEDARNAASQNYTSPEERTAAAMEFIALSNMPDETTEPTTEV